MVGEFGIDDSAGLVAIDLQTGAPVWCADLGIPPVSGRPRGAGERREWDGRRTGRRPPRRLRQRRHGLDLRRTSAPVPSAPAPPASSAPAGSSIEVASPAGAGPRITLRAARTKLVLGQRTRLTGMVSGVPRAGGQRVRIEADDHPFGRFSCTLARVRTRADGTYRVMLDPARNVRLRAVLERPRVRTTALTVWTELPATIRRLGAGGPRPRVRVTVLAPPRALVRSRLVAPSRVGHGHDVASHRCRPLDAPRPPDAARHSDVPGRTARNRRPRPGLHARAAAGPVRRTGAARSLVRSRAACHATQLIFQGSDP